jgi:retron-type reverse transcriptase
LIKSWIAVGLVTEEGVIRTEKGIPQGSVISPLLANIYLDEFDKYFADSDLQYQKQQLLAFYMLL